MRIPVGITDFILTETLLSCPEVDVPVLRSSVKCYLKDPEEVAGFRVKNFAVNTVEYNVFSKITFAIRDAKSKLAMTMLYFRIEQMRLFNGFETLFIELLFHI